MATDEEKVQVVIRVRPLLQKEIVKGCKSCIQILPDKLQVIIGKDRKFTFDQLLGQDTDQASTFEMCVKPLVEGCFQGYNATVFAYGQTGSGKTFTILGPDLVGWEDNSTQGIIPRAIGEIFKRVKEMANVQFSIRVSYLEVYQEELNDLLHMTTPSQDIHIRENEKGHTLLIGIQELVIHTVDDGLSLLEQGSAARHTGTTKMNERSSRSHTVFTLYLDQRIGSVAEGTDDMQYVSAKFHFVDLAGSERACRTGNEGARFKESIFINTGLLALGNVISALGDPKRRATHIPYRDSKITRILKGSLGGNSKTVMLTCLSPSEDSFAETLNSLKYANRARNICNKPVMNRDPHAVQMEEMQSQIEALKVELDRVHTAASSYSHHSNAMVNVEEHLQQLEEELARSKQHCSDYRLSAAKSKKLVEDIIEKGHVAEEEIDRLRQWIDFLSNIEGDISEDLNLAGNCSEDASIIDRLQFELLKCKAELASDEDIFVDKVHEITKLSQQLADNEMIIERMRCKVDELTERCQEREHEIEGQRNELTIQQEQILSQQLLLQQQEQTVLLKERELLEQKEQVHDMSKQAQQTKESAKMRIASVQTSASLEFSSKSQQNETNMLYRPWTAPHTDPPEAVVQEFRTQSRLLLARLEEQDQVQTPVFSDSDLDDDKVSSESKKLGETVVLRRGAQPVADVYLDSQTDPGAVDILNTSIVDSQSDLKQTQYKYQDAMTKLRDLQLGIRLKEELIRELVQSSKQTDDINCQYLEKVKEMEREVEESQAGLEQMKKKLEEYERLADKTSVQHLRSEYKQKLVSLQQKVDTLQQQQKSSRQMSAIQEVSEKKLLAVEANLGRMKNAQEALKHKLKKVAEEKLTIQRELERYQQQVSALEKKAEKQQLVLKEKTREAVSAGRRLRNQTLTQVDKSNREAGKLELEVKLAEKQQWLDAEVNSLLKERSDVQALQEDLARREKLVQEREAMLAERNALEMRILRSSQIVSKDVLRISTHLQSVESSITCKKQELKLLTNGDTTTANENVKMVKRALKNLQQEREKAIEASRQLETTLSDPQNERRMMALEEAIEALDGMLEYQDQSISEKESGMDESALGCEVQVPSDYIMSQLKDLSAADAQQLLGVYFEKVVLLREETRKKDTLCKELQLTIGEREQTIRDLEIAVQETSASAERRITQQEKESEQRVQFLVQQLADATSNNNQAHQQNATNKIQQLEKDLYYYKTTSRELKRRLREASNSQDIQPGKESPLNGGSLSEKSSLRKTRRELRQLSSSEIAARSSATEQNRDQ